MQGGGDPAVAQRLNGLDESGDPGRGVQVTDVGLDRAQCAPGVRGRPVPLGVGSPEGGGERLDLDRIADRGTGAVSFHVADGAGRDVRNRQRLADHGHLARHAGGGVTGLGGTVVVDGRPEDHGMHAVTVGERVGQPLEHDDTGAVAEHRAVGVGAVRAAATVGRLDASVDGEVAGAVRHGDGHAAA